MGEVGSNQTMIDSRVAQLAGLHPGQNSDTVSEE
jgi:hypothetical protein